MIFRFTTLLKFVAASLLIALSLSTLAVITGCAPRDHVAAPDDFEIASVVSVVDGDTIVVSIDSQEFYCRAVGVDAPESVHPDDSLNVAEGEVSSDFLKSVLRDGDTVFLERDVSDTDKYGRLLRYIWLSIPDDPSDPAAFSRDCVNAIVVREGFARSKSYPPDTSRESQLEPLQRDAVASGSGVSYLWD